MEKAASRQAPVVTQAAVSRPETGYFEHLHDGRIYVVGSQESSDRFRQSKNLPYALTLINAGPSGETIVVEVDKDDPSMQERLLAEYKRRYELYAQVQHEGRIYVMGSPESLESFEKTRSLPYALTQINAGPGGETVVFEVDKENPRLQARLQDEFHRRHNYYAEEIKEGRIYILGSLESHEDFKKTGSIPYALTQINAGPGGETVVFEVDKSSSRLQERLQAEFERRHESNG
ncbi:MAG: hypothetical protein JXA90_10870 [Planctomycetes bacterium]|nr:hypothetical protein [Planctomycetota bacterium]